MTGTDKVFAGAIPALYQEHMVSMIFEPYAEEMAKRTASLDPRKVLEIAAGTGVVTRVLATRLAPSARIIATDLNQPMLDLAAGLLGASDQVTFRQADALALPFEDDSFDVVVCQFGVMFFADKLESYREVRRVLKDGGVYLFAVWDQISANAFVTVATQVLTERYPEAPPRFMERTPHGYYDTQAIIAALLEAGFTTAVAETVTKVARATTAGSAAIGYCQGTPLAGEILAREPGGLQAVTEAIESALAARFGPGPIEGGISAQIITAKK
ncbi:class I SAM-dependent methyltransferase [Rhizobium sp. ZW T2_16]|uniref:class I SAM-dependent methyltransferase n=1 Tax=Rhizobium sp. ZW T2_16 TaxID=3378083 RepID=UPI003853E5AF